MFYPHSYLAVHATFKLKFLLGKSLLKHFYPEPVLLPALTWKVTKAELKDIGLSTFISTHSNPTLSVSLSSW